MVQFHSLACGCPVFSTPFIEETVISPLYILGSFVVHNWTHVHRFISGLSILFHWSMCLFFVPVPYCFDYCSLLVQFEVREHDSSSCVLLPQDCSVYSLYFVFPYKFFNYLFYFCENCSWYFDRDCTESIDCLGLYGHFNNVSSSSPWTWCIFPSVCVVFKFFISVL